jgi:citrate lyase synthetase
LVLFIIYTAIKLVVVILVESISGLSAHQEENLEKLSQSPIGKDITAPVLNSNPILTFGEKHPATEQYLVSIKQKDSVTSKKQDNFS